MAWYDAAWSGRFLITNDHTKTLEAIDSVYYDLADAPAAFWAAVKSDAGDVRVTTSDGTTELAAEVSGFDTATTVGSLFFAATGLSTGSDTAYYVYYGNSAATTPAAGDTYGKYAVWGSHVCVWHLDEAASPAVNAVEGSTASAAGTVTFGATGQLRSGVQPDGSTGYLSAGNKFGVTGTAITISAWINPTTLGESSNGFIVIKALASTNINGYTFALGSSNTLRFYVGDASASTLGVSSTSAITLTTMQWVAVTYDGANVRFYVNAVAKGAPAVTRTMTNSTNVFIIGNADTGAIRTFDGVIDELRVAAVTRSANWITTEYNNQSSASTFWTTGAAESNSSSGYLLVMN